MVLPRDYKDYVYEEQFKKDNGFRQSAKFAPQVEERLKRGPIWSVYKKGEGFFPLDRKTIQELLTGDSKKLEHVDFRVLMFLMAACNPLSGYVTMSPMEIVNALSLAKNHGLASFKRLHKAKLAIKVTKKNKEIAIMINPSLLHMKNLGLKAKLTNLFNLQ